MAVLAARPLAESQPRNNNGVPKSDFQAFTHQLLRFNPPGTYHGIYYEAVDQPDNAFAVARIGTKVFALYHTKFRTGIENWDLLVFPTEQSQNPHEDALRMTWSSNGLEFRYGFPENGGSHQYQPREFGYSQIFDPQIKALQSNISSREADKVMRDRFKVFLEKISEFKARQRPQSRGRRGFLSA